MGWESKRQMRFIYAKYHVMDISQQRNLLFNNTYVMNYHQLEEISISRIYALKLAPTYAGTSRSTKQLRKHLSLFVCLDATYLLVQNQQKSMHTTHWLDLAWNVRLQYVIPHRHPNNLPGRSAEKGSKIHEF